MSWKPRKTGGSEIIIVRTTPFATRRAKDLRGPPQRRFRYSREMMSPAWVSLYFFGEVDASRDHVLSVVPQTDYRPGELVFIP